MITFKQLLEKNVPTNPKLWSSLNHRRKQSLMSIHQHTRMDGVKQYKVGGGWKTVSESLSEETGEEITIITEEGEKKKVKLGKVQRGGSKKFYVHVKNDKGNVVKVSFGDPNMEIKRDDPERRKSFRARHNCDNPAPLKARYWSCKQWRKSVQK